MNHPSNRFSKETSSDIEPFNNYDQNNKLPWFCYLCGVQAAENSELPKIQKEKKNISKTLKTSQQSAFYKSINLEAQIAQNTEINNRKRMSVHNGSELKSTMSTLEGVDVKRFSKLSNKNLPQNKQIDIGKKFVNGPIDPQPNVMAQFRKPIVSMSQIQALTNDSSQPLLHQSKNMTQFGYNVMTPYLYPQQTNITKVRKSMTFSYGNPIVGGQTQKKNQNEVQKINIVESGQDRYEQKATITSCKSYQIIQYGEKKKEQHQQIKNNQNTPSKISTTQEIPPPFTQFRQVVSLNDPNQPNLMNKKSSNSSKAPKFLRNIKKKSSKTQSAEMQKSIDSQGSHNSYIQFGNKIRIGIRKAESINSRASDSDQYSEVLSHGEKSFLMPEINEVEEMSRVSSVSGFRNWEDDHV